MGKYQFGTWMTSIAFGVMNGYNFNVVTGIASSFAVWGIAYMLTGLAEGVLKAVGHMISK